MINDVQFTIVDLKYKMNKKELIERTKKFTKAINTAKRNKSPEGPIGIRMEDAFGIKYKT